ncbi:resistance-nodulation-cell division superfamily [Stylonychia lemnae]|uniref:Resistance-nodulation-cell division superfamily n=1 Tax=Stylonychia lemnae TaxID=5949 RepID=A0A077ZV88_STYLE|nr:resistance-nodulation-cell division superfamily [Stylonychia lemnae]|eukprot:CDW73800.1 resistance-nodulation-cell division superfamily [Stylonychia lemnae]
MFQNSLKHSKSTGDIRNQKLVSNQSDPIYEIIDNRLKSQNGDIQKNCLLQLEDQKVNHSQLANKHFRVLSSQIFQSLFDDIFDDDQEPIDQVESGDYPRVVEATNQDYQNPEFQDIQLEPSLINESRLFIALSLQIVCVILTVKYNLLDTINMEQRDFFISSDIRTKIYDTEQAIEKEVYKNITSVYDQYLSVQQQLKEGQSMPTILEDLENKQGYDLSQFKRILSDSLGDSVSVKDKSIVSSKYSVQVFYKCKTDCQTVFTPKNILKSLEFEEKLSSSNEWNKVCYNADSNSQICPDSSLKSIFAGNSYIKQNLTQEKINAYLQIKSQDLNWLRTNRDIMQKDFSGNSTQSIIFSSIFYAGEPNSNLPFINKEDIREAHSNMLAFGEYAFNIARNYQTDDLEVIAISLEIGQQKLLDKIKADMKLCFICFAVIWLYVALNLKSLFLSTVVMINIGIGADNSFLYHETWIKSKKLSTDISKRVAITFQKGSKAIIATSITNLVAFIGTCTSSIMPISGFGIFSIIVVPFCYFMIIFVLPSQYVLYEKHIKQISPLSWLRRKLFRISSKQLENNTIIKTQELETNLQAFDLEDFEEEKSNQFEINKEKLTESQKELSFKKINEDEGRISLESIYRGRFLIISLTSVIIGLSIWRASMIQSISYNEKFLSGKDLLQKALDYRNNLLYSNQKIQIYFNFGINKELIKNDKVSKWDTRYQGELKYNYDFDISNEKSQLALYNFCLNLRNSRYALIDQITGKPDLSCFILDFHNYLMKKELQFPVAKNNFMKSLLKWLISDPLAQNHLKNLEIGIDQKLSKINYVKVRITSMGGTNDNYDKKYPIYQDWQGVADQFNLNSPIQVKGVFQSAYDNWAWIITEKAFFQNAFQGLLISLAFAFVVIIVATQNIIVTLLAVITISCVLSSVIGMIQLIGWKIGISESLAMDFFVGFSVDYIVHVAMAYSECREITTRRDKMNHAFSNIGLAVFSGAITTIISAIFLLFTSIFVLKKFGLLIIITILLSIFYSLTFLPACLYIIGPEKDQGDMKILIKRLYRYLLYKVIRKIPKQSNNKEMYNASDLEEIKVNTN